MQRKTLSEWMTTKYLLILRDEENFAERGTYSFNLVRLVLLAAFLLTLFGALSFFLSTTLLEEWFDPRAEYQKINRQLVELETQVDSLTYNMAVKEKYIQNIKAILSGNLKVEELKKKRGDSVRVRFSETALKHLSPVDSAFRKKFEEVDYELLNRKNNLKTALQELYFLPPVNGIVSDAYNVKEHHYGVDLVAKKDEPIKAVAEGSVIFSSWTQDSGNVIGIQHRNNIISFYKHNSVLLKEVGEVVKAGDLIAIIGNTGEQTDGPHLHFELWYDGNPVNPEEFILF